MGIDIFLVGVPKTGKLEPGVLDRISRWALEDEIVVLYGDPEKGSDGEDEWLSLQLFPAAEPVLFSFGHGVIEARARTNTSGPGYHQHLCEALDRIGQSLGLEWRRPIVAGDDGQPDEDSGDDTNYFWTRDRAALEKAMLGWLAALAGSLSRSPGVGPQLVCMPIGEFFERDDAVVTPMGPRDGAWLGSTAKDPRAAIDFWPWWDAGVSARNHRGHAVVRMWNDVRWRPPLTEEEARVHQDVHSALEQAYRLDDSLPLPSREWAELLSYGKIEEESEVLRLQIEHDAARAKGPLIGYRRGNSRRHFGPFSLTLPASLGETVEEDGAWIGFDEDRTVHLSLMSLSGARGAAPTGKQIIEDFETPEDGKPLRSSKVNDAFKKAAIKGATNDAGNPSSVLVGFAAVRGTALLLTIAWTDPAVEPWAKSVWESISGTDPEA